MPFAKILNAYRKQLGAPLVPVPLTGVRVSPFVFIGRFILSESTISGYRSERLSLLPACALVAERVGRLGNAITLVLDRVAELMPRGHRAALCSNQYLI